FDFDPASMIPSHMPEEIQENQVPTSPSAYAQVERMRRFCKNLRLISVPSTLLKITQREEQLKFLQLKKMGAPLSWNTVLNKVGIDNPGEVKGNNEFEKWVNEEMEMLKVKAMAAKAAAELGLGGPEGPGQGKGGGRPNTNKKAPKVAQKGSEGGEPRTTLKTS
ncbi:MAG: hypothetical protein WA817_15940, partial [Candidatus Acidiferrum sp.]